MALLMLFLLLTQPAKRKACFSHLTGEKTEAQNTNVIGAGLLILVHLMI